MADQFVQIAPDSTGKKVDVSELTVSAQTVERQRMNLADPTDAAGLGKVLSADPVGSEYGAVVRAIEPTFPIRIKKEFDIFVTDANTIYIGYAAPGTATSATTWQVKKISFSSGAPTSITWSTSGVDWDNRATHSYA